MSQNPLAPMNPQQPKSIVKERKRAFSTDDERRVVGLGYKIDQQKMKNAHDPVSAGLGDLVDIVRNSVDCPVWNIPNIEQVRWTLAGPLTNFSTEKNFGATIDLFGSDRNPDGIDYVESTMAQVGELQTHTLICAIGMHLEPEPLCWTGQGNAWYHPGTAQQQKPPSPNVFSENDVNNGALGGNFSGTTATQFMMPALIEWGWWANLAAWHMVRGYDLRWMIGQKTNLLDENLRHTAYMPPNAQEGSASSSQVDICDMVRRITDRYTARLGSAADLLKIDFQRLGSAQAGAPAVNLGIFQPSRAFELVGATYGGMDLRSMLKGNSEFRQLTIPYFLHAGIPIGLRMEECDSVQANLMRRFIDVTQGQNANVPPFITDTANVFGGLVTAPTSQAITLTGTNVMLELPLFPAGNAPVAQQMATSRVLFKGGDFKITLLIKGFEVDEDWFNTLKNNPDLRDGFMCECGCGWAK